MPRPCSICTHPKREAIETALSEGGSFRNVAARFGTSATALHRHRKHVQSGSTEDHAGTDVGQPEDGSSKDAKEIDEAVALLPREEKLAALLAQGNISVAEACRQCGFNPTSSTIRNRLKPGGDIRQRVVSRMRQLGLTLDVALLKVREKLDARETKFFQKDGLVVETRDVEAHRIQLDAAETVLDLHGAYPKPKEEEQAKHVGPIVAIEFVSRQAPMGSGSEQRVTAVLDFGARPGGNGDHP